MKFSLRRATLGDTRRVWKWSNETATRRWSSRRPRIPWTDHQAWFRARLSDLTRCRIYIAQSPSGRPLGQVRFEKNRPDAAQVSISIDRAQRGKGIGTRALLAGCRRAAKELALRRITAYIMNGNQASLAAFRAAGFASPRRKTYKGFRGLVLTKKISR